MRVKWTHHVKVIMIPSYVPDQRILRHQVSCARARGGPALIGWAGRCNQGECPGDYLQCGHNPVIWAGINNPNRGCALIRGAEMPYFRGATHFIIKTIFLRIRTPFIKIRRSHDRVIFIIAIHMLVRHHICIQMPHNRNFADTIFQGRNSVG